ncbi:HNH endonuclease [Vibrio parahaemolyticus]|nr:HNH endonuclease [Vibrio parahaemolyticus]
MSWQQVREDALVACRRHCCLCYLFKDIKMEVHHIVQRSEGVTDTFDNAIPLCFDCHGDMRSYDKNHPKGSKYTHKELKQRRDEFYSFLRDNPIWTAKGTAVKHIGQQGISKRDQALLDKVMSLEMTGNIIYFLKNYSFATPHEKRFNDYIHYFSESLEHSPLRFADSELNKLLAALISEFECLSRVVAQKTYPARGGDIHNRHYEVPREYPSDHFDEEVGALDLQARRVCTIYDELVTVDLQKES